jgi:hypothetical protein
MALQPLWALVSIQFPDLFTIGRTPWTSDQLVPKPLPKHRTAQTRNKCIYIPNIYALIRIRTHDPSVWASEYILFLRPCGHCDRQHMVCKEDNIDVYVLGISKVSAVLWISSRGRDGSRHDRSDVTLVCPFCDEHSSVPVTKCRLGPILTPSAHLNFFTCGSAVAARKPY